MSNLDSAANSPNPSARHANSVLALLNRANVPTQHSQKPRALRFFSATSAGCFWIFFMFPRITMCFENRAFSRKFPYRFGPMRAFLCAPLRFSADSAVSFDFASFVASVVDLAFALSLTNVYIRYSLFTVTVIRTGFNLAAKSVRMKFGSRGEPK
jgi:hypothetical protein